MAMDITLAFGRTNGVRVMYTLVYFLGLNAVELAYVQVTQTLTCSDP